MQSSQTHSGMVFGNVDFLNAECLHGNTDVLEISVALVSGEKYVFRNGTVGSKFLGDECRNPQNCERSH